MKCLHHNEFISYLTFSSLYSGGSNCLTCDATSSMFSNNIVISLYVSPTRLVCRRGSPRRDEATAHLSNYSILHMYIEFSTTMDLRAIDARACCWLGCAGVRGHREA